MDPQVHHKDPSTPFPAKMGPRAFISEPWRSFCRRRRTRTPSLTRARRFRASRRSAATSPRRSTTPSPRPPPPSLARSPRPPPSSRGSPSPFEARFSPMPPRRRNSPAEAPGRLVTSRFVTPTLSAFSRFEFDGK